MSKEDRIQEAGKAAVELADARARLGDLEARADNTCRALGKARKLLCPEGRGEPVGSMPDLPSTEELRSLLQQIRQDRQVVEECARTLQGMGCPVAR